jgi:hypothetical protein
VPLRPNADREHRLDPVRWTWWPRRIAPARAAAVAALLLVAAGALWSADPHGPVGGQAADPVAPATDGPVRDVSAPEPADGCPTVGVSEPAGGFDRPSLPSGTVGVAVTPADPAVLGVLRPGDRVDIVAVDVAGEPSSVATNALVIAVPGAREPAAVAPPVGALYLAVTPDRARRVVGLPRDAHLAVLVRP